MGFIWTNKNGYTYSLSGFITIRKQRGKMLCYTVKCLMINLKTVFIKETNKYV